jgi:putative hydrolase of the HAD superfamily
MPMEWVIFDYGNVISQPQSAGDLDALAREAQVSVAAFQDAYWPRRIDYDRADLDGAEYWGDVGERLGQRWDGRRIARMKELDTLSWLHLSPGTVAIVGELSAAGQRLALLSNAPVEVADAVARLPLARHFEHLVFSCHLKATKPDADCYRAALDRLGAQPAETIFIDDRAENVTGAQRLGMAAVQFTGPETLRQHLADALAAG